MNRYFAEQLVRHPSMTGLDLIKYCYQSVFGAEHMVQDEAITRQYLLQEWAETPAGEGPLYEMLSCSICRVNLSAWKREGRNPEALLQAFLQTGQHRRGSEAAFRQLAADALETARPHLTQEDYASWQQELQQYLSSPIAAVHHSEAYRLAEHPAYRVVDGRYLSPWITAPESYIWDLDGTLLDSYGVVVSSLVSAAEENGHPVAAQDVLREVKLYHVGHFMDSFSAAYGVDRALLQKQYRHFCEERNDQVELMPGARETLEGLAAAGAVHYVYTHRGSSTADILRHLGIDHFFREIVTAQRGFAPKPAPDGVNYLVKKYNLDPEHTYYVGDRTLDAYCAKNAGIRSIQYLEADSFVPPTGAEDLIVQQLTDILP